MANFINTFYLIHVPFSYGPPYRYNNYGKIGMDKFFLCVIKEKMHLMRLVNGRYGLFWICKKLYKGRVYKSVAKVEDDTLDCKPQKCIPLTGA